MMVPISETFTATMRLFFAVTIFMIAIIAFEFFNMMIPSLLLPAIYIILNIAPANVALSPWTNTVIYMTIGAFALANVMDECGLLKRIAYWCILRCGGTYNGTLYGLFLAGVVLGIVTFNNHCIIVVTLAYGICRAMNLRLSKESALIMVAGIFASTGVGMFTYYPFTVGLIESGAQTIVPDFSISTFAQTLYNWPVAVFFLLFLFVLTKINKTKNFNVNSKEYFQEEYKKLGALNPAEKKTAILVLILMVYLFTQPLHGFAANYGFMVLPWILYIPQLKVASDQCLKNLNMAPIFFIVACMSIGSVGMSIGVGNWFAYILTPILTELNSTGVMIMILLFGKLANIVMTPAAMMSCFTAPITLISTQLGIEPMATLMTFILSTDLVFFPHEQTYLLILFGFGMISMKDFIKYSVVKTFAFIAFFAVAMIPYWMLLGIL